MRQITSHIVNPVNDKLKISVTDEPGAGSANHRYEITGFDATDNASAISATMPVAQMDGTVILFQNGPINEHGVNGITQEALLAIVEDRLTCFQGGPFACVENADALSHVRLAMQVLQNRTRERMSRGVEGKNVA
jgi:hypothetical protein